MFGIVDEVVNIVKVLDGIVELLRDSWPEEPSRDFVRLAFFVVLFPRRCSRSSPQILQILPSRCVGHIVLVIGKPLVTNHAHGIAAFVGALAEAQMVRRLRFDTLAQEDSALERVGYLSSGEA